MLGCLTWGYNMLLPPDWIHALTQNEEGERKSDRGTVDYEKRMLLKIKYIFHVRTTRKCISLSWQNLRCISKLSATSRVSFLLKVMCIIQTCQSDFAWGLGYNTVYSEWKKRSGFFFSTARESKWLKFRNIWGVWERGLLNFSKTCLLTFTQLALHQSTYSTLCSQ